MRGPSGVFPSIYFRAPRGPACVHSGPVRDDVARRRHGPGSTQTRTELEQRTQDSVGGATEGLRAAEIATKAFGIRSFARLAAAPGLSDSAARIEQGKTGRRGPESPGNRVSSFQQLAASS